MTGIRCTGSPAGDPILTDANRAQKPKAQKPKESDTQQLCVLRPCMMPSNLLRQGGHVRVKCLMTTLPEKDWQGEEGIAESCLQQRRPGGGVVDCTEPRIVLVAVLEPAFRFVPCLQ